VLFNELMLKISVYCDRRWPLNLRTLAVLCLNLLIYFCPSFAGNYLGPLIELAS
jgi:hypothetical protein